MMIYAFLFYIYVFFDNECTVDLKKLKSDNITIYKISTRARSFQSSTRGIVFEIIHSFVRDFLCTILIAVLNLLTLIFMRRSFRIKKQINKETSKIEKAENNLTYMVLTSSIINIIGHIFIFIHFLPITEIRHDCIGDMSAALLYLSYSINFFIYYFFNNHFKNYFKSRVLKLMCKLKIISKNSLSKYKKENNTNSNPTITARY